MHVFIKRQFYFLSFACNFLLFRFPVCMSTFLYFKTCFQFTFFFLSIHSYYMCSCTHTSLVFVTLNIFLFLPVHLFTFHITHICLCTHLTNVSNSFQCSEIIVFNEYFIRICIINCLCHAIFFIIVINIFIWLNFYCLNK